MDDLVDRVRAGEVVTITRDGEPVAELRTLPRQPLNAAALVEQFRHLPPLDAADLPDRPTITAVTLAELSVGPLVTDDDQKRADRQARLQAVEASFDPLPLDAAAARAFGRVAAVLRRAGGKPQARAFDALIAAIAIANDLPLHTCNEGDVSGIPELRLRAIPHPDDR